jgi:hypothetical protein
MAYDPTAPIIQTNSTKRSQDSVIKTLEYDFGTFIVEEINMDTVWPAGDPCPTDKETLVIFHERKSKSVDSAPLHINLNEKESNAHIDI